MKISDSSICAGERGKDSCQGDSGGPLFYEDSSGKRVLVGIVSSGTSSVQPLCSGIYGIYTRVSVFHEWIEQGNFHCKN